MCGIVVVRGQESQKLAVDGLKRLEYRGYDSFGFAYAVPGAGLEVYRSTDFLQPTGVQLPSAQTVVGHTRWATHGAVSIENCHPHLDVTGRFALIHNGVVDNFLKLKQTLIEQGHHFHSETDSEVILKLIATNLDQGSSRLAAVAGARQQLQGRNTFVCLFEDGEIIAVKKGSPLVVGRAADQLFIASDILAFGHLGQAFVAMGEDQILVADSRGELALFQAGVISADGDSLVTGSERDLRPLALYWAAHENQITGLDEPELLSGKSGFKHYMLKEIFQQWRTIPMQGNLIDEALDEFVRLIKQKRLVVVTGAGGAYFTAQQVAWMLRQIGGVPAIAVAAYELRGIKSLVDHNCILLAVSQSGETADTLDAISVAKGWGMVIACVVNMPFSSMSRQADFVFHQGLGPEECVLSTKSASAQVVFGYLLAMLASNQEALCRQTLDQVSHALSIALDEGSSAPFVSAARYLSNQRNVFVLGRDGHFANALIGALNIKEASYLHAEAFSAGELKHGVIALIEAGTPVILFMPAGDSYMQNVAQEVKARGAYLIAIGEGDESCDVILPLFADGALISAMIPCQLLAYYVALERGLNPDRPRNLAKSVTVQ